MHDVLEILSSKRQTGLSGNAYLLFSLLAFLKERQVYEITTTNSTERSPSEATSSSASQDIPYILWNLKVHYRTQKSPPPVSILSQISTVHGSQSHFLKIHFKTILTSTPRSSSGIFPVAYREGGGVWGVQPPPPPKFRRYRRSPRSHEQEEPASRFSFAVHCVLIRL